MKKTCIGICCAMAFIASAMEPENIRLIPQWKSEAVLEVPECVLFEPEGGVLYVSNVAGKPAEKNGKGFISQVALNGEIKVLKWAEGLNAPKGMAISGKYLYVSDIDELIRINLETGKIATRYPACGAVFLNDVATDSKGNVYVGDSSADNSVIYKLMDGELEVWLKDPQVRNPNGLHSQGDRLLVGNGQNGHLNAVSFKDKTIVLIAKTGSGIDGIKPVAPDIYLTSDWAGNISLTRTPDHVVVLQNTTDAGINAADFEYVESRKLLVVPTFFDNRIAAYMVEK